MGNAVATLVLLRHGESDWNALNLFTGWVDVGLTEKGRAEAVRSGELIQTFRGAVKGSIIHEPHGPHGFGYDPLFYHEPFGCTFGEAAIEDKMTVSHRAQALDAMFNYLRGIASR